MIHITGINVVKEFISSNLQNISELLIVKGFRGSELQGIAERAREKGISMRTISPDEKETVYGIEKIKNGVVARIDDFSYPDMEDLLGAGSDESLLIMLDRVYDPHNLGAIARSAYCFGADGIVIQKRRGPAITSASITASAGALAHIPVVRVTNLSKTVERLKKHRFWVYGTVMKTPEHDMENYDFRGNVLLILGSEGEGIREKLLEKSDFRISIPIRSGFDSLNVSVAAGIVLYRLSRKRRAGSHNL